ncbi:MAG: glycosyl hydrolase [Gemmatimonadaceae bacterium]
MHRSSLFASSMAALVLAAIPLEAQWIPQSSGTVGELRGLSVVSPDVAWASGVRGTVVRTTNGGRTWMADTVPSASKLDLRAIAATSTTVAHALSIADSGRIFRTTDGGRTWSQRFMSLTKGSFFDAIRFWDARHGIAFSDPVDGRFLVITTNDGGSTWKEMPSDGMPAALPNEGGFAASGSVLAVHGTSDVWLATGGATSARIFHSSNRGKSWTVHGTPIRAGTASEGIFSVAFRDAKHGVISGGDYTKASLGGRNVAFTSDGGATWTLVDSASSPQGFKSAVAYVPGSAGKKLVAVGLNGTHVSSDAGMTWAQTDTVPYNSLQLVGRSGYAAGPKGRVARYSPKR